MKDLTTTKKSSCSKTQFNMKNGGTPRVFNTGE
jgi:hypothetical protein